MNIARKVAFNTIVQLGGKVLTTGASLLIVALVTRSLGLLHYGEYYAVSAYCQFFAVFADLGVNVYLIKRLSTPGAKHEEETGAMLGLRVVSALAVIALGYVIMLFLPYSPVMKYGIAIVLWAIFAQTVNSLFVAILQAKLEMQHAVVSEVAGRLTVLLVTVITVLLHLNLVWVISAVTAGAVLNMVLSYLYARRYISLSFRWNMDEWRAVLRQSLPISITAILAFVYFKIDSVLLSILPLSLGRVNTVEVGIYGQAYKVLELLLIVPGIFVGNIFPILSTFIATKDERIHALFQKAFDVLALFGLPITAIIFMLAPKIVTFVSGASFLPAAVPLRILAFAVLLTYFTSLVAYTVLALNQQRGLIRVYAVAAVFNVIANVILIPKFSYVAAAYVTLFTEIIVQVGSVILCRRQLNISLSLDKIMRLLGIVGVMVAIMTLLSNASLFINLAVVIPTYLFLIVLTKVVSAEDIKGMLPK
jgi:O-antigen/teichoic acid export membrane protein